MSLERHDVAVRLAEDTEATAALVGLLNSRFSCRGFLATPVPHKVIHRILEISQLTPSWCNTQPWQVIVTEGEGTERLRTALYDHAVAQGGTFTPDLPMPAEYQGVYGARRKECGGQLYASLNIARGDKAASSRQMLENFRLFGAPHTAIVTTDDGLGLYGAVDCGCYISSFLLAAQSFGVAAIPQAALAIHAPFMHDYFGLPANRKVLCGISFGYADPTHPANSFRTRRADLADAVQFVTS